MEEALQPLIRRLDSTLANRTEGDACRLRRGLAPLLPRHLVLHNDPARLVVPVELEALASIRQDRHGCRCLPALLAATGLEPKWLWRCALLLLLFVLLPRHGRCVAVVIVVVL